MPKPLPGQLHGTGMEVDSADNRAKKPSRAVGQNREADRLGWLDRSDRMVLLLSRYCQHHEVNLGLMDRRSSVIDAAEVNLAPGIQPAQDDEAQDRRIAFCDYFGAPLDPSHQT